MLGKTLSRYTILEQIGSGGMGTVYRARDVRLNRDVAVKVLPVGALADDMARHRFRKEALSLSQLNHPNIATVHDFDTQDGVDFIVMEYIEGTTLNTMLATGPLLERDILQFGQQAAQGLAAAHERSIVHRDLKPANLRITPDRRVKILDFGLAELFNPGGDLGVTATATSASTSGPPGTLPYMAPEQLREEKLDHRTDIYAIGAVLYETATGQRPFPETRGPRLIDAILHHQPQPPRSLNRRLSAGLETVILKCLDKEPDRRYQSARELAVDLNRLATGATVKPARNLSRRVALAAAAVAVAAMLALGLDVGGIRSRLFGSPTATGINSIAVLPLDNLTGDPNQEYFADGITETLIGEFTRIRALRVISRWSVMQYKGARKPLRDIAKELRVDAVILGSITRTGDRVSISIQFNHAPTDTNLWAKNYDVPAKDILALQNDVVQNIVREIEVQLTPQEQAHLAKSRTVNPQALEAYLLGRFHWNKRTPDAMRRSLEEFQRAASIDPQYATAYAGIADAYSNMVSYNIFPALEALPKGKDAARKALAIDDTLAEAHISLGNLHFLGLEPGEADREFRRGLDLNPGYATAHHWYALHLASQGHSDDALREIRRAQELEPLSLIISSNVAWCLYLGRRFDEAIDQAQKTIALDPTFSVAHGYLGQALAAKGRYDEAIAAMQKAVEHSGGGTSYRSELASIYALAGRTAEARAILDEMLARAGKEYVAPYDIAAIYVGLGDRDNAFRWLDRSFEERNVRLVNLRVHPRFDSLRDDPRFAALLRRLGLPT